MSILDLYMIKKYDILHIYDLYMISYQKVKKNWINNWKYNKKNQLFRIEVRSTSFNTEFFTSHLKLPNQSYHLMIKKDLYDYQKYHLYLYTDLIDFL